MTLTTDCRRAAPHRLEREMNQLLSTFFPGSTCGPAVTRNSLAVNAWEDDEAFLVELETPGVKPEHVDVSVEGEELSIKIDRPRREAEGVTYHRRERAADPIARSLRLSSDVDSGAIEANLQHGVLTIRLPKVALAGTRKVAVTTAGE